MNQRTTLEIIAPTVEEAIAQGLTQLGLTADAVSVEVLDAGTKGFFGLGKTQVRVRLTVNPPPVMPSVSDIPEVAKETTFADVPNRRAERQRRTEVEKPRVSQERVEATLAEQGFTGGCERVLAGSRE